MKKYKVWGGEIFIEGKQKRAIVATKTKKEAINLFQVSYHRFINYCCETGNETEIKIALSKPNTVFYTDIYDYSIKNYREKK